ncbi:FAD-dependent oxidoreductase [Microbacterium saperdae]
MNHALPHEILVVGAGMVAHRLVESLLSRSGNAVRVTVVGDEDRVPYDRARLTSLLAGASVDDLTLDRSIFEDERVALIPDDRVLRIDRKARTVTTRSRRRLEYDTLILATGSYAARASAEGADLPGCFDYRTLDDAEALAEFVRWRSEMLGRPLRGAVIGGGLRGLEAAGALQDMDVETTVAECADRLMPAQLDAAAGELLKRQLGARGIAVRTDAWTTRLDPDESGAVTALEFHDGSFQRVDVVVFAVGVRPRDELARNAGLDVHPRGGVIIDDRCSTSDPRILAIGEVANHRGRGAGLVAPGYAMAEVVATRLLGGDARFTGYVDSTTLTLSGIEVASFGDAMAHTPHALEVVSAVPEAGVYRKLVLSDDARILLGGILIGDVSSYAALRPLVGAPLRADPSTYVQPGASNEALSAPLCRHFEMSRAHLLDAARRDGLTTFSAIIDRLGSGRGCNTCKTAIAGILSGLADSPRLGRDETAPSLSSALVFPDGAPSVVARMPRGEVTPDGLIVIAQVAKEYALRARIISDQGIALFGARREQLPPIRARLAQAGFLWDHSLTPSSDAVPEHGVFRSAADEHDAGSPSMARGARQARR